MRHGKVGRKFGRESHQRTALFRSLCTSLVKYGRIKTTLQKAKDLRRVIERAVTMGKKENAKDNPLLANFFHSSHDKEIVGREAIKKYISNLNTQVRESVEKYLKDPKTNQKPEFIREFRGISEERKKGPKILRVEGILSQLLNHIVPRFKDVPGGYTRIYKLGKRRGDQADMALIEFSR